MPLYKQKYRTQTTRLAGYDYASQGYYYITICTRNREHFFGKVEGGEMWLSALGNETRKCWQAIPEHFPFVELDAFVIMPDHVHGVLYINRGDDRSDDGAMDDGDAIHDGDAMNRICTMGEGMGGATGMHNPMLSDSLGKIVRWYKGRSTYEIRRLGPGHGRGRGKDAINRVSPPVSPPVSPDPSSFAWQPRYYDHIVRSENDLDRIRTYIQNNPAHWKKDEEYSYEDMP